MTQTAQELIPADEFSMTLEERIQHSLVAPKSAGAMSLRVVDKVSKSRIAYALAELAQNNTANVQQWLEQVAAVNPKVAIELYLSLLEFSIPKLKAIAVANFGDRSLKDMSLSELQEIAKGSE